MNTGTHDAMERQVGQRTAVSVNEVLLDLLESYQPAFNLLRVGVGLDLDPSEPYAWVDREEMENALGVLLDNAIRHVPFGGIIVCRSARESEDVSVAVGDNRPQTITPRTSTLFSRARLAAQGGEFRLRREPGSTTWFAVRLPAAPPEDRSAEPLTRVA